MYQIFRVKDSRLKYCDIPGPGDIVCYLFVAGQCIQKEDIRRLIALDPELFRSTFFDSTGKDPAEVSDIWDRYSSGHEPNHRPPMGDRRGIYFELHRRNLYGLSLQTLWFLGPLWLRLSEEVEMFPELAELALNTFTEHTNSLRSALFGGPMRYFILICSPVVRSETWLKRFIAAGGAPAFLGGSVSALLKSLGVY